MGVVPIKKALEVARDRDLDLVEVAPGAKPPVCKVMDYGKYKYQQSKKQTQKRTSELKEIKLRPSIDKADLDRKVGKLKEFLEEGHKTKVSMFFRGRERGRPDLGMVVFHRVIEMLEGKYNVESEPRMMGNSITLVIAPK